MVLQQDGDSVIGSSVEDGSGGPRWEGCLQGKVVGPRATVRVCYTNMGGADTLCPNFGPADDQYVLLDDTLMWYRRNGPGTRWELYRSLLQVTDAPNLIAADCVEVER